MIAIVEDDNNIRELLVYTLNNTGFEAIGFSNGDDFYESLKLNSYQLVLLDIMLTNENDGIAILKNLKKEQATSRIPVILLTAKDTEYDKIVGLDSGADDYVTKPFGMMELVARIKAVLRRVNTNGSEEVKVITYQELKVDDGEHKVYLKNQEIELTLKEYKLLVLLLNNVGSVLNRDKILQKIWGYDFDGETRTVDVHIRSLRLKLKDYGDYLETVRGVGYRIGKIK